MFADSSLSFNTNWSTTQTITTTADSATVIDITGAGAGNAPAMVVAFPGKAYPAQNDWGNPGDGVMVPFVYVAIIAAPTSTSNTLTVKIEAAPDSNDGNYNAGSYEILGQTDALAGSVLTVGRAIIFPLPMRRTGTTYPLYRFYKLNYTASATLTPMKVMAGIVVNPPSSVLAQQIPANFLTV